MNAEIICVGSELLLGDIVNTNAQFLSKELALLGIDVHYQTVVGDNRQRLTEILDIAFKRCDMVITTGGLGPTKDDLTKEIVARYFKRELEFNSEAYDNLKDYFEKRFDNYKISESNKKQAYVPKNSIVIQNTVGTAPGVIIEENKKIAVLLPGPPKEMKYVFNMAKKEYLSKISDKTIISTNIKLKGIGEAHAADMIADLLDLENPTVAPYAKEEGLTFRVTASAKNKQDAQKLMRPIIDEINKILGEYIYEIEDVN